MISYGIRGPSAVALKSSCTSGELVVVIVTGCGEENEPLGKVTVASPFRLIVPPSGGIVFVTDGNGRFAGGCRLCVALVQPKPINSRTERSNKYIRRTAASPSPRNRGYLSEARSARTSSVDLHSTLSDMKFLLGGGLPRTQNYLQRAPRQGVREVEAATGESRLAPSAPYCSLALIISSASF